MAIHRYAVAVEDERQVNLPTVGKEIPSPICCARTSICARSAADSVLVLPQAGYTNSTSWG